MIIIGITGPAGAGKDVAAKYIATKLNLEHVSGGDILRTMLANIGLKPNKNAVSDFGTFLRTHYGSDAIIKHVISMAGEKDAVVNSGIRAATEAEYIKNNDGVICFIDASPKIRHDRISVRKRIGDDLSPIQLKELDKKENKSKLEEGDNLDKLRPLADVIIQNDGTLDELYIKLDKFCEQNLYSLMSKKT